MKAFDNLSRLVKLILQFFFGWFISGLYRIVKGIQTGNMVTLIVGILALVTGVGNAIFWVIDFITILLSDRITVLA
ncbi:MAG: hypothetical protein WC907_05190 [Acholeplasmataceae bacterium]